MNSLITKTGLIRNLIGRKVTVFFLTVALAKEKGAFPKFDAEGYLAPGTFASRLPAELQQTIRLHGRRPALWPIGCRYGKRWPRARAAAAGSVTSVGSSARCGAGAAGGAGRGVPQPDSSAAAAATTGVQTIHALNFMPAIMPSRGRCSA